MNFENHNLLVGDKVIVFLGYIIIIINNYMNLSNNNFDAEKRIKIKRTTIIMYNSFKSSVELLSRVNFKYISSTKW